MKVEAQGNVVSVYFDDVYVGWEQWLLLSSDRHHDSAWCDRELEKKHLDKAVERNALIIDAGDCLDAMQGRFDPRRSYPDLRPEFKVANYYDAIVADAARFYGPYAKNWLLLGRGNHESSTLKNAGTDPTSNLALLLNNQHGGAVIPGFFGGWVRFMFTTKGVPRGSLNLKYFHGAGGEAPVTRGVIQTNRQAVYLPDADIVLNGHSHNNYLVPISRERLSNKGKLYKDIVWFARTPGYKNDYREGAEGWEVERGGVPKPLGCMWARLFCEDKRVRCELTADIV